ncbi:MAG: hypothetical protein HW421_3509 [Ignavibacteria bacterium]|nr:hypothetical protein [Ignavibacteria bacterium]
MAIKIVPISTQTEVLKFIKCHWNFYENDNHWVPPVIVDRLKLLDTEKNPFYKHSKIQLFLAENNNGIVGRIAAIKNDNHNIAHDDKTGFFGFFECIDDQEVARSLFDSAASWLRNEGLDIMRGPMNPSINDEIGLLIEGFNSSPVVLMTYNPKYYISLIENYGFIKSKDLYAYLVKYENYMSEKMKRMQYIISQRYNVTYRNINFKDKAQFRKDVDIVKHIYNVAWEKNWGAVKMTDEEFDFLAADLKQFAEPSLAFMLESKGNVVGFALALPDINQSLINNKKGHLLGAAWHLLTKKKSIDLVRILVLGVLPEYRGSGLDALMYYEVGQRAKNLNIFQGEASWILEDNVMMNRGLTTTMSSEIYKKYRIYDKQI